MLSTLDQGVEDSYSMPEEIEKVIHKFKDSTILVIGDYMIDEYVIGTVERISPEAPVPVVQEKETKRVPGGAGNVVCNLTSLGARVLVTGILGNDLQGKDLISMMTSLGLHEKDIFMLAADDRPTTVKTRILAGNQQVCRLDREKRIPLSAEMENEILSYIRKHIEDIGGIIFSDYDKGVVTPGLIQKTVSLAREKNIFVSVDPQVTHFEYYKEVDVLTPNHHEAGRFLGRELKTDEAVEKAGKEINDRLKSAMSLITRGEKGMSLIEAENSRCRHFPTRAREVFDVTGAGDTVISIYTLAMISGATREQAVHLSNTGAGIVVGKIGAATITTEDLIKAL